MFGERKAPCHIWFSALTPPLRVSLASSSAYQSRFAAISSDQLSALSLDGGSAVCSACD